MAHAGRIKTRSVVVHNHLAVDDLVLAIEIDIGSPEVVETLPAERTPFLHVGERVEQPPFAELSAVKVERHEAGARVVAAAHDGAWTSTV